MRHPYFRFQYGWLVVCFVILIMSVSVRARRKKPTPKPKNITIYYSTNMTKFRALLEKARNIVFVTGAGLSEESDVVPFLNSGSYRDYYYLYNVEAPKVFREYPLRIWEYFHFRKNNMLPYSPNRAHYAITRFEDKIIKEGSGRTFTLITHNVDALHLEAGTKNIVEMHGSFYNTECVKCGRVVFYPACPICDSLSRMEKEGRKPPMIELDLDLNERVDLPTCGKDGCDGLLKPCLKWVYKDMYNITKQRADEALAKCDMCVVIGLIQKLYIYPSPTFATDLVKRGVTVAQFSGKKLVDEKIAFYFPGNITDTLLTALGQEKEEVFKPEPVKYKQRKIKKDDD